VPAADVSLVVFDLGDTLVTGPPEGPARRIADAAGLTDADVATIHRALMTTPFASPEAVSAFLEETFGPHGAAAFIAELWAEQEEGARPIPGAAELLGGLRERGVAMAVVSNIWPPYLAGVQRCFPELFSTWVATEHQVYSYELGEMKPSPRMLETLLARCDVAPGRVVMVGDSFANDIAPAHASGVRSVWLLHRPAKEAADIARARDDPALAPALTVASIAEVSPDIIINLLEDRP
jgi:HAD superfamily hydrolase (TIGR01509 family)